MAPPPADSAFLADVVDACTVPMLAFDVHSRWIACNRAAARALGVSADAVIGRPVVGAGAHWRALAGESFAISGARLAFDAGADVARDLTLAPVCGRDGAITGGVVTFCAGAPAPPPDEWLRERRLHRTIVDAAPFGLLAFDRALRLTEWNAGAGAATGMDREAVLGRPLTELFPDLAGTALLDNAARALRGETVRVQGRWYDGPRTGRRCYDLVFAPTLDDGGAVTGAILIALDVTDRARAEEATRAAQEQLAAERAMLRAIVDATPAAIMAFDRELRYTEWNRQCELNTGVSRADALGRPLSDLVPPDFDRERGAQRWARVLAGETLEHETDAVVLPGRTEPSHLDSVLAPLRAADDAVIGGVIVSHDVSARVGAERALRDERAFLRSLIDASPSSIVAFDRELRQTEWNPRAERNTGIPRATALGRTTEELYPGFVHSDWYRLVRRVLGGEVVARLDYELTLPETGEPLILDVTMAPLYDASGMVVGALVMSLDVTERVQSQRALEESESRYRHLFAQSAAMQMVLDAETRVIVDANEPALSFYGHARDALIGMPADRLSADPAERRDAWLAALLRDGAAHGRRTHVTASGALREVEVYATVLTRAGRRLVHLVTHDVTERVRAEAERDRLIGIIEATTDVVATIDPATQRLRFLNRAGRALLGVDPDTQPVLAPELLWDAEPADALAAVLRDGLWRGEVRFRSHDGRAVPVSAVAIAHRDASGAVAAISAIFRDISAEKTREAELAAAREAAERASSAKSAFLAGMSHELRTPLGAVLGFAQFLRDGHAGPLNPMQLEYLDDVLLGARQLHVIVDDALDLARVEAGLIDVRLQAVNLREVVDEALVTVAPLAAARHVTLERTIADDAVHILSDPARVRQVLVNFLTNAIKFNRDGGHARVEVAADAAATVRLTVRDTGRGIAPEDLPRLFVEFQRLGVPGIPGSGLGLAIARRIVEALGGTVEAESRPGSGSAFHARLPRTPFTGGRDGDGA